MLEILTWFDAERMVRGFFFARDVPSLGSDESELCAGSCSSTEQAFFRPYTDLSMFNSLRNMHNRQYLLYLVREAIYDGFAQSVLTPRCRHTFDSSMEHAAGLFSGTDPCLFVSERGVWYYSPLYQL